MLQCFDCYSNGQLDGRVVGLVYNEYGLQHVVQEQKTKQECMHYTSISVIFECRTSY